MERRLDGDGEDGETAGRQDPDDTYTDLRVLWVCTTHTRTCAYCGCVSGCVVCVYVCVRVCVCVCVCVEVVVVVVLVVLALVAVVLVLLLMGGGDGDDNWYYFQAGSTRADENWYYHQQVPQLIRQVLELMTIGTIIGGGDGGGWLVGWEGE
jgi:hypothetical protein